MKKMFENWKRYVETCNSDKSADVIEETSAVGGVQGHAGVPLGSKEDNEEFNESEKKASKLKGEKLAEMYSTVGIQGGVRISIVAADKEHAGHVERSQHQGLRNVMEADDDDTLPMDDNIGSPRTPLEPKSPVEDTLKENGYVLKKILGEGEFGVVVLATEKDEYGGHDFAIKILKTSKGGEAASREKRNYNQISQARDKSPLIAKHFPEVFKVFKANDMDFIVMEVLEPLDGSLRGLFGGVEQLMHRKRPMSAADWPISKFSKDKDVSKRVQISMSNDDQLEKTLRMTKKSLETFGSAFGGSPGPAVQKDIDIAMAGTSYKSWLGVEEKTADEVVYKFQDEIIDYMGNTAKMYLAIMDDLRNSPPAKVFVTLVCKKIVDIMKKHSQTDEDIKPNSEYIIQSFLERFQKNYRMSSSLKSGYSDKDIGQTGGRMPDAESIYQAIVKLQEETGLFARDLHDGNAMRRPGGDIVIVDVGMFKTESEIQQMKTQAQRRDGRPKFQVRENRIRIKLKR